MMTLSAVGFLADLLSGGPKRQGLDGPVRPGDVEGLGAAEDVAVQPRRPLGRLGRLREWRRARIERRLRNEAISRLAELSPHLLDDIGVLHEVATDAAPSQGRERVLRMPAPEPARIRPEPVDGLAIAAE